MHRVYECLATAWMDLVMSRREESIEPQLPPDAIATILDLDRQELSPAAWPPRVNSRGFLGWQGALP